MPHNGRRNEYQQLADGKVSSASVTDTLPLEYEFNDSGNIMGIRHNGYQQQYEYSAGQLSGTSTQTGNHNYRYDVTGNRTVASATGSVSDDESILNYNSTAKALIEARLISLDSLEHGRFEEGISRTALR